MQTVDLAEFVSPHKRRKVDDSDFDDVERFRPGSIMRIKLKNFMSYSLSEFHMGPNLNMIIGPNGTGKSTIVCAICLGLAGKPDFLGKSSMQLSQFIKQGEPDASIEIELKGKSALEKIVIRCEISRSATKTQWFKNKVEVSERHIKEVVKSLDIQLDNLCHFLPQDRVSRFAAQKPTELLKEIERSFEDGELLSQHEELIRVAAEAEKVSKEKVDVENRLSSLAKQRDALSTEVEKFKKYQEKKQDLLMHQNLIPFVKIQDAKVKYADKKAEKNRKAKVFAAFKKKIAPITSHIESLGQQSDVLGDELTGLKDQAAALRNEAKKLKDSCSETEDVVERLQSELRRKLTEIVKKTKRAETLEKDLEEWRTRREQYSVSMSQEKFTALVEERNRVSEELNSKTLELNEQKEKLAVLKHKERSKDSTIKELSRELTTNDKLSMLRGFDSSTQQGKTFQVIEYLRRHKEQFEGLAYESAVVSLTVEQGFGNILGNITSLDSQLAIITTSTENHQRVTRRIMDDLKMNVSFRQISESFQVNESERLSPEELKRLGFDGYLSDFVTGPAPVKQMLCEQHLIHLVPIARKALSPEQLERVQRHPKVVTFVSGDQIMRSFKSQYGSKQVYTTATFLNPNYKLFNRDGLSQDAKEQIERRIQAEKEQLKDLDQQRKADTEVFEKLGKECSQYRQLYSSLTEKYRNAQENRRRATKASTKIESLEGEIEVLRQDIANISTQDHAEIKRATNEEIKEALKSKMRYSKALLDVYTELHEINLKCVTVTFSQFEQENRKKCIQDLALGVETRRKRLEDECASIAEECKELKAVTSAKIKELNKQVNETLSEDERADLSTLAKSYIEAGEFTEDELASKIETIRRELHGIDVAEESSITRYAKVESEIADLETRLPDLAILSQTFEAKVQDRKSAWLPRLEALVTKISQNFHDNFSKVYPAGEVRLAEDESFNNWRLEIAVQFREDEQMSVLDGTTQSGGERSVSTAIFLNSLQGLMNAPFRVVDEINQGMDARNERLVHKLIVESACSDGNTSQYFLITPKLLTDLQYHEKMSVHCIMAGKYCPDPSVDEKLLRFGIAARYV